MKKIFFGFMLIVVACSADGQIKDTIPRVTADTIAVVLIGYRHSDNGIVVTRSGYKVILFYGVGKNKTPLNQQPQYLDKKRKPFRPYWKFIGEVH